MRNHILAIVAFGCASAVDAAPSGKRQMILTPEVGAEASATAGSTVFERTRGARYPAVRLNETTTFRWGLYPTSTMQQGQLLAIDTDNGKKLVACEQPNEDVYCLIDRNLDGAFESVNSWTGFVVYKLPAPVPYTRDFELIVADQVDAFRQTLIYLGTSGQTLRLSYREFVNDLARPAFTEEVTFNLSGTFPETVAYKDLVIDVLGVDNAGLRYVIRKAGR